MTLTPELGRRLYTDMWRIRLFEEEALRQTSLGSVKGALHTYCGEEAVAVGVCAHLRDDDYVLGTHRSHGHCLAKGAPMERMMAELFGRTTGSCRAKGGSMHIADFSRNILGANGIVAGGIGPGTGTALASRIRGTDQVSVVFFGDGAAARGPFHEGILFGSLWKLPVVYVCENNQYQQWVPRKNVAVVDSVADMAASYAIPGVSVDGQELESVYEAAGEAIDRARGGRRPHPHRGEDLPLLRPQPGGPGGVPLPRGGGRDARRTRPPHPVRDVPEGAPVDGRRRGRGHPGVGEGGGGEIRGLCRREPPPRPGRRRHRRARHRVEGHRMRTIAIRDALREALHEEMARDDSVFVMGEDVIAHGGPYTVTQGIAEKWPDRIFETPIAEAGIVGLGVGAALAGMRPVVEIMYLDFVTCAMDEVVNQAAKMRYMTGGQASVPMVIRLPCGPARLLAAQHSQIMESWFMHVPGLQVAVPTTPYDAKGLMKTAIRSPDPVVFFEYKAMYVHEGEVPDDDDYVIPFGAADVKREGEDATVVAIGGMVPRALEAGVALEDEGYDIEVVDPRTLSPLDADTICESVRRTGRAVVCEMDSSFAGSGAEIAAMLAERCFHDLRAPIVRVGSQHVPMPFAEELVNLTVPDTGAICAAVRRVMG